MQYYKDTNNKPFVFEDNVTAEIIANVEAIHKTTLTKITEAQYKAIIAPTSAEIRAKKKAIIFSKLREIDVKSIRSLRAVADNVATASDLAKIKSLNLEADDLRTQLKTL